MARGALWNPDLFTFELQKANLRIYAPCRPAWREGAQCAGEQSQHVTKRFGKCSECSAFLLPREYSACNTGNQMYLSSSQAVFFRYYSLLVQCILRKADYLISALIRVEFLPLRWRLLARFAHPFLCVTAIFFVTKRDCSMVRTNSSPTSTPLKKWVLSEQNGF